MPASKKTLRNQQQQKNKKLGIGDEQGRLPSQVKDANVMAASHSVLAAEVEVVVDNNRGITDQENQTQLSKYRYRL